MNCIRTAWEFEEGKFWLNESNFLIFVYFRNLLPGKITGNELYTKLKLNYGTVKSKEPKNIEHFCADSTGKNIFLPIIQKI